MPNNLAELALRLIGQGDNPNLGFALYRGAADRSWEQERRQRTEQAARLAPLIHRAIPKLQQSALSGGQDFIRLLGESNLPANVAESYVRTYQNARQQQGREGQAEQRATIAELRLELSEKIAKEKAEREIPEERKFKFTLAKLTEQGYDLTPDLVGAVLTDNKLAIDLALKQQAPRLANLTPQGLPDPSTLPPGAHSATDPKPGKIYYSSDKSPWRSY